MHGTVSLVTDAANKLSLPAPPFKTCFSHNSKKKYKSGGGESVPQKVTVSAQMSWSFVGSSCRMTGGKWHLATSKQGAHHRLLKRHLASITVKLVFGLTTAEQVDAGQLSPSTCSRSKWNTDEAMESSFDCIFIFYLCVCSWVCVFILCTYYQSGCMHVSWH